MKRKSSPSAIATSTKVVLEAGSRISPSAQAVACIIPEKARGWPAGLGWSEAEREAADQLVASGAATGNAGDVAVAVVPVERGRYRQVVLVGVGGKVDAEALRAAGGALARFARKKKISRLCILLASEDEWQGVPRANVADAIATGFLLASFRYEEHKGAAGKSNGDAFPGPVTLTFVASDPGPIRTAVQRASILADAQNLARTIASRPGNEIHPPSLASVAMEVARDAGISCRALDEKQMEKLGMGGILAVGSGSRHPPRMIVLEYSGAKPRRGGNSRPLLIVGKAITFDTGGISIKPAEKMGRMIYDKSGGLVVLGVMWALAKLKIPANVVGILSAAENTLSDRAYRPGDIVRMTNGVTVEVTNTDAEGRLVLGDALAWGIKTYRPAAVVDLATLTGGVIIALGKTMAGAVCNDDSMYAELVEASGRAGEKIWRLPLGPDQREQIKSERADIVNSAGRDASPLQGAAFLSYFIPDESPPPWAHLDIAGVADTEKELPYYAKGSTCWGVRTLVEWITARTGG